MMARKRRLEVPAELDYLDLSVLSYLREDSKTPIKKMAKDLSVHPNTLIQRIRKMEKTGVLKKYSACVDYSKAGYDLHILVMIKVKRGRAGLDQLQGLTRIRELEAVYATTGLWDAIALCRVRNRKHLLDVIEEVGNHPIVLKTSSSIILNIYKDPDDFNPFA
ncbi:winged helix-turn-helix transcriptional regulator [Candidatus Micrarchaeota archaeon]|nr:winged helix-turn-helix transcriptional regulator [Candidatus Micrarchaeota archaeon]